MLTIEKIVKLLPDNLYEDFLTELINNGSSLPEQLVSHIDRNPLVEQTSDELCIAVYGDAEAKTKQKFFQLAHHTFKLTSTLSQNHPSYLLFVVNRVQSLYSKGKSHEAHSILDLAIDVASKINDHQSEILFTNILAQHLNLEEQYTKAAQAHDRITKLQQWLSEINSIYLILRNNYSAREKVLIGEDAKDEAISPFITLFESESTVVSLLARFAYCYVLDFLNNRDFFTEETQNILLETGDELRRHPYLVFPMLEDLSYKVSYLRLKFFVDSFDDDELLNACDDILENSSKHKFWTGFVNSPEIFSIAIQNGYYLTNYMTSYRKDHPDCLPDEVKKRLAFLRTKCKQLLDLDIWEQSTYVKMINLKTMYCGVLLLGSKEQQKESVQMLEELLIVYQQVPFHTFSDGIYVTLIIGYFSLGDYERVSTTFKRYRKITSNRKVYLENDLTISAFYYVAKWLDSNRRQYLEKLRRTLDTVDQSKNLASTGRLINQLLEYYAVPVVEAEG